MGMYDVIRADGREGQVKLWSNQLRVYEVGDTVYDAPRMGVYDFDIAMREGGWVHVDHLTIQAWDDTRDESVPCFDKWGDPWVSETENIGELGRELRDMGLFQARYYFDADR
jgi:hypothetical protein